jgi:hypothetical protein
MNYKRLIGLRNSVVAIGYYVPDENPKWLGTGFIVGDGTFVITCAHVVGEGRGEHFSVRHKFVDIKGKKCELSCWVFVNLKEGIQFIRFPIEDIEIYHNMELGASYFGELPDVAHLKIDISNWKQNEYLGNIPTLKVHNHILRNIGTEVVVIGYPSTALLLYSNPPQKFNCLQPMMQFCKLAGVLPTDQFPLPHFLAFDTIFARGSSGSPICELETGNVIAMVAELHPFRQPTINYDGDPIGFTDVPSAIGLGVPSNFFYEMSISNKLEGKYKF